MTDPKRPVIALNNIYTSYEGAEYPVIRDVSVEISSGEFVIIGGPNGAGKTTLLETINGMLKITHGDAHVLDMDVRLKGIDVRKRVGYMIQNFSFDPMTPFSAGEVVLMGRYGLMGLFKRPSEEDLEKAHEAIKLLGIEDLADTPIGKLSGGQQQKVLIAQCVAKEPDILLLDEPFSNLDILTRDFVSKILGRLAGGGCTIVIVSHAFDALPATRIRVIAMNDGRITLETCEHGEVEDRIRAVSGVKSVA